MTAGQPFSASPVYMADNASGQDAAPGMKHIPYVLIIALALSLRLIGIDSLEPWHDETYSIAQAHGLSYTEGWPSQGFSSSELASYNTLRNAIAANQYQDSGNGALYVTLLHYWCLLFGNSTLMLRIFSLACFALTLILTHRLSMALFHDRGSALAAMALIGMSTMTVSMPIRPYMLAMALTCWSTALAVESARAERASWRMIMLHALVSLGAMLSHFSTVSLLLAQPIAAALIGTDWRRGWRVLLGGIICAGLLLIWFAAFGQEGLARMGELNAYYTRVIAAQPDINSFFTATRLDTAAAGIVVQLLWVTGNGMQFFGPRLAIIGSMLLVPIALIALRLSSRDLQERRTILGLAALTFSPMAYATAVAIISGHTVSFQPHYAVFAVPICCVLLTRCAMMASLSRTRTRPLGLALATALLVVNLISLAFRKDNPTIAPNAYDEIAERWSTALDRYADLPVAGIHSSKTAAYLSALYAPQNARPLKHFVNPDFDGISGLLVQRGERPFVTMIRPRDARFGRSEPKDDEEWHLTFAPLIALPDSIDAWSPTGLADPASID